VATLIQDYHNGKLEDILASKCNLSRELSKYV
jgi:hypothetical protein